MSYDGNGQPGKGPGASAMSLNGRPFAVAWGVRRIARNVSQQGVGAEPGSHESVQNHWTRSGTNVLLGRPSRQGEGGTLPIA
jgi:hypothetical protein